MGGFDHFGVFGSIWGIFGCFLQILALMEKNTGKSPFLHSARVKNPQYRFLCKTTVCAHNLGSKLKVLRGKMCANAVERKLQETKNFRYGFFVKKALFRPYVFFFAHITFANHIMMYHPIVYND